MAGKIGLHIAAIGCGVACFIMAGGGFLPASARAQVNINVNIGPPPPVIVESPPPMLFLSEPALYVAVGTPYDIFFVDGRYYYLSGNNWFLASGYRGPWVYIGRSSLPPGLRRYKVVQLREYREREYRVYKVQGPQFKGKQFYAVEAHSDKDRDDDHDHGNGHGRGRGHGK